jgi:DNA-directed RNA polymerase subunit RPC12/RpoP
LDDRDLDDNFQILQSESKNQFWQPPSPDSFSSDDVFMGSDTGYRRQSYEFEPMYQSSAKARRHSICGQYGSAMVPEMRSFDQQEEFQVCSLEQVWSPENTSYHPKMKSPSRIARRHSLPAISENFNSGKDFKCMWTGCDKVFDRKYNLKSHLKTHNGEREFMCGDCGFLFARQHDLNRHRRSHSKDKEFACSYCSKSFARRDAVIRHENNKSCRRID